MIFFSEEDQRSNNSFGVITASNNVCLNIFLTIFPKHFYSHLSLYSYPLILERTVGPE